MIEIIPVVGTLLFFQIHNLFFSSCPEVSSASTSLFYTAVCWTKWFDRDNPSGTGDWELLKDLRKENSGQICEKPLDMEVVTTGKPSTAAGNTGQIFYQNNPHKGFVCRNKDQKHGGCLDYKVRCWTEWFDRDNPSGSGDWETFKDLRKENPGKICPQPRDIEAQTLSGQNAPAPGDNNVLIWPFVGLICKNKDQKDKKCEDYRVRFRCFPPYCAGNI
uniref:WxxW domain-containing protein n=1 Tax=Gouania willdenowi TaxID=441366 RepID=A0A8C5ENU3_GOUWI